MKKVIIALLALVMLMSCEEGLTKEQKKESEENRIKTYYIPKRSTDINVVQDDHQGLWLYFTLDGRRFLYVSDGHGRAITEISATN